LEVAGNVTGQRAELFGFLLGLILLAYGTVRLAMGRPIDWERERLERS
jgi:hypothetical protein